MEKRELICVSCPMGCRLTVTLDNGAFVSVSGNTCKRGEAYAKNEVTAPKRILTTTVKTKSGKVVPVKTDRPILKQYLFDAMSVINKTVINDGQKIGSVVIKNILDSGADIVLTSDCL